MNNWNNKLRQQLKYIFFTFFLLQNGLSFAEPLFLDLTRPFDEKTIYWPTSESFQLEEVHKGLTDKGFWYESNNIRASEHGGTHLDAPAHFAKGKWHVDDIPLDRLIAPGILIDVRKQALDNPDYKITQEDFIKWEEKNGKIPENCIVLIQTGWEDHWYNKKKYLGTDKLGDTKNLHFPGIGKSAAQYLVKRKIAAVGLDTPSLDYGKSITFPTHQILGKANILGFENIFNLKNLLEKKFRVIALPMKIAGGSGAPLRIIAELEK